MLSLPKKGHGLIELVSFVIHIVVYVRVRKFKVNTAEPWTSQINVVSNKMLGEIFSNLLKQSSSSVTIYVWIDCNSGQE